MAPKQFTCPHKCGCQYSTARTNDLKRHMSTQARHRGCTQDCPHYTSFLKILDVETPEGFAGKQAKLEKLSSVPQVTIETIKVLCILDPTRRERSYENTFSSASWITVNGLPLEVVEGVLGCKGLEGYVFPVLGVKNAIRIYDWAYVTFFCFQEQANKCTVEFSTWETFSAQLVGKHSIEVVSMLQKQQIDVIFGTIDLSIRPSFSGDPNQDEARIALLKLAEVFPVFPSPQRCDEHGSSVGFMQTLDLVARKMGTARPRTVPWDPELQAPRYGWVLKREFGDATKQVYFPGHPLEDNEGALRSEMKRVRAFMGRVRAEGGPEKTQWLAQEYVPALASLGEFRFMCVDGEPVRTVVTGRHDKLSAHETWSQEGIKTMLSLEEIMSLVERGVPVDGPSVFNPVRSFGDTKRAKEELKCFVRTFLKHLEKLEGKNSSLRVFCRVDVGIFIKAPNTVSYFVNDVERGITTSLWAADGPWAAGVVGMSIVEPLKRWIAMEKTRLGATACDRTSG